MSKTLDRLQAVVEAATPGPWRMGRDEEGGTHFIAQHGFGGGGPNYYADSYYPQDEADGALVVLAINTYPEALAVVRAAAVYGFCDRTDRREACNQPDCTACVLRDALAAFDEAATRSLP